MIEIIPAIDLIEGKCVRLSRGDYNTKKIYNENPLDVAREFEDAGIRRLHLVDLDGAKEKHVVNLKVLEEIAARTNLIIDFGGGIKTDDDIIKVINSGANLVTIGSIAVTNPDLFKEWLEKDSRQRIILGADIVDNKIAISGWKEVTDKDLFQFVEFYMCMGLKNVMVTDISKDGMLLGSSTGLYKKLKNEFPHLHIIASGGVTNLQEIDELIEYGVEGVIIGKAIYEGKILLSELKKYLH